MRSTSKVYRLASRSKSAGPLGLWACGASLSSILHSSLFPIVVLSSPCGTFPSSLWSRPLFLLGSARGGEVPNRVFPTGGGKDLPTVVRQAPWSAALLALLAVQDRARSSQEPPGANQEPPRATQDRLKISQVRSKIAQERPKSPQERPKTTPRATQEPPRATPGRPRSQKSLFFLMFFNDF